MTDIFKYLLKTFVLLRDLVGYLIPGLVFLALLDIDRAWTLANAKPGWILLAAILLASYVVAQLLAAAGYALLKLPHAPPELHPTKESEAEKDQARRTSLKEKLYYSTYYPDIFIEANRQDTVHLMRIAASMALMLAGAIQLFLAIFAWVWSGEHLTALPLLFWVACIVAGLLLFLNSRAGDPHNRELALAAVEAAKMAEQKGRKPAE
jgi:drug/metabolite transporter (DMT)-like permease